MSQKRIKEKLKRKDAVAAIRGLDQMKQLPDLLRQAQEVNKALIEENARLNAEVSNILEEHENRLETIERIVKSMIVGEKSMIVGDRYWISHPSTDDFSLEEVKTIPVPSSEAAPKSEAPHE